MSKFLRALFLSSSVLVFMGAVPGIRVKTYARNTPVEQLNPGTDKIPAGLKLKEVVSGLQSPTAMADPDDGTGRLFIAEQSGLVKILRYGKLMPEPLLDLRSKLVKLDDGYDERGLLGIALHPKFRTNHKFYVFYSAPTAESGSNCKSTIAEYTLNAGNLNMAALSSARVLLEYTKPEMNHDGGQLAFGPDGYLYIGVGDGGGAGDEHGKTGNGQNLNTYLAKILRIDVNHPGTDRAYSIPADNPFIRNKNARPEIYAYGLRNPWRFSFDTGTGRLFCGDVGQDKFEEVDLITRGGNYGWRKMEANHCYNPAVQCKEAGMVMPINEYEHPMGISITGGYVYRGKEIPALSGKYIFADWSGPLFCLSENGSHWTRTPLQVTDKPSKIRVLSLGQDHLGEVYFLTSTGASPFDKSGVLYKLAP